MPQQLFYAYSTRDMLWQLRAVADIIHGADMQTRITTESRTNGDFGAKYFNWRRSLDARLDKKNPPGPWHLPSKRVKGEGGVYK